MGGKAIRSGPLPQARRKRWPAKRMLYSASGAEVAELADAQD